MARSRRQSPPPLPPPRGGGSAPPPLPNGNGDGLNSRYLRLQDLRRMRNMFFSSRRIVEGQYAGRHASPLRGHSVEFNDFRQYMPGDEIGDLDSKI